MTAITTRERVSLLAGLLARERDALAEFLSELADFDDRRSWEDDAKLLCVELAPRDIVPVREVVTAVSACTAAPAAPALRLAVDADAMPKPYGTRLLTEQVHPLNVHAANALDRTGEPPRPNPLDTSEAMTANLSRLHLTVTRELLAKIEAAQLALSHVRPGATIADILELGADTALKQDAKRKGLVEKPCPRSPAVPTPSSDHIPAEIRRAVWKRDGGCCQWKLANGEICGSRYRLQFDHIEPKAKGGKTTVANVRLL